MMERSRRRFLKIAGVSALALGAKPFLDVFAASEEKGGKQKIQVLQSKEALTATRWAMVIDSTKFKSAEDLAPIIEACNKIHNIPEFKNKKHEIKWIWAEEFQHAFPARHRRFLPERIEQLPFLVLCNHCESPPCVRVCPTQATFKRKDGIVQMDYHRCIGCRFCMAACPYGSRSFNFRDPRPFIKKKNPEFPTRMKGVVEKCNFCAERLAVGKMPNCVEAAKGALAFGDLEDPESRVRELLRSNYTIRRKQGLGTGP
ncbi:MAG: sulfate reduction electron transfer complex DsrMKJOP subunit DsrO, partial [Desulfobacterales bacterium]